MDPKQLRTQVGQRVGASRWFEVTQSRIAAFADVTEDHQFIHLDPARAAETPFGGTVAHGFLTLSLLSAMSYDALPFLNDGVGVNYGFNRLRFVSPVASGQRIRGHFTLAELTETPEYFAMSWGFQIEIEETEKPAIVGEWLNRRYFDARA